ncbi:MAG: Gfo/Idh/MocA family oxidoreductase [Armatimonadetes bacterium]|nr:Gfo/Idh/MocA family oxidoreductase [Armatimonadota bacterium]MDW8123089.1 Gfo/Idh/MocA family oxidoreductase [Armatimonadota bacterium]
MAVGEGLKVGFIGAGSIAQVAHLPNARALGASVTAIADAVLARAQKVGQEYGISFVTDDYRQLLKRDDVQAVVVSVPTYLHHPVVMAALRAEKDVFCEKPPALNERQAEEMANEAEKKGRILMYGLQMRYRQDSRALKTLIEEGELGSVYFGRATYLRRRGAPGGWFARKKESGGGPLLDIGVHLIDLTWWLMGRPKVVSVSGFTLNGIGARGLRLDRGWQPADIKNGLDRDLTYDVEDYAGGFLRLENGAVLLFEVCWQMNLKSDVWGTFVAGSEGGASLPPLEVYRTLLGEPVTVRLQVEEGNAYQEAMREFFQCIKERRQPLTSAQDGVTIMKILTALYRSAQTGKERPIP